MNNIINRFILHKDVNRYTLTLFVLLAFAVSWFDTFDKYAESHINDSIVSLSAIYGVSRAINAAVSVSQSAEISVGLGSLTVGELLDPINDLIEQFSEVMMFSIASLAMQKILLLVTQDWVFNLLITLSGLVLIASLVLKRGESSAFKVFAILVLVRTSLLIVLLSNSVVDNLFLDSQIAESEKNIEQLQEEVNKITAQANQRGPVKKKELQKLDDNIHELTSEQKDIVDDIAELNDRIKTLESDIDTTNEKMPWPERIWNNNPAILALKELIKTHEDEIDGKERELALVEKEISSLYDQRDCAEKHINGESCSWLDWISNSSESINSRLSYATDVMKEKSGEILSLMALVILRSIILPLFFWYLIFKTVKWVWKKEFAFSSK